MNKNISTPNGVPVPLSVSADGIALPAAPEQKVTADAFRKVMRGFASTVTIVTTEFEGRDFGMVATAVVSVSMAPPLLMVAVQHSASSHDPILRRQAFCVNVLTSDQQAVAASFISDREKRFRSGNWAVTQGLPRDICGLPYLHQAQSVLVCTLEEALPSKTHTLFMGRVEKIETGPVITPLLYCQGAFGTFSPPDGEAGL